MMCDTLYNMIQYNGGHHVLTRSNKMWDTLYNMIQKDVGHPV